MWRNVALVALSVLVSLLCAGEALADEATANSSVHLSGHVEQSRGGSQILLTADASDGNSQHLELVLIPASGRRSEERGRSTSRAAAVMGQFNISGPGLASISGQVQGQLDRQGRGTLHLTDQGGMVNAQATFWSSESGQVEIDVVGTLPQPANSNSNNPFNPSGSVGSSSPTTDSGQPIDHTFWYLSRATGFSAYLLLFLSVTLGLAMSIPSFSRLIPRWRSFDLHEFTALLGLAFVVAHMVALLGDRYVGFTLGQMLVPFVSTYRPVQNAAGVIGFYVLVVVIGSFYLRRFITRHTWRAIHYLSFGLWTLVLAHSISAGTDTGQDWAQLLYWSTGLVFAFFTTWRLTGGRGEQPGRAREGLTRRSA